MTTTREEAIEMSREAGFYYDTGVIERHLERFIRLIELARAKENEACIEDVRTVGGAFAVECEALIRVRMK